MCCIENLVAPWLPNASSTLDHVNLSRGTVFPLSLNTEGQGTAAVPEQSVAHRIPPPTFPLAQDQTKPPASSSTRHPPSPPCSNTDRKGWPCGAKVIEDPQEAEDLMRQGWAVEKVDIEEGYRGRRERYNTDHIREWLCGTPMIKGPQEADDPMRQSWLLDKVGDNEDEHQRGRPSKRKRCTTTDDGSPQNSNCK